MAIDAFNFTMCGFLCVPQAPIARVALTYSVILQLSYYIAIPQELLLGMLIIETVMVILYLVT